MTTLIFANAPAFAIQSTSDYVPMEDDECPLVEIPRESLIRPVTFPQPPKLFSQPIPTPPLKRSHTPPLFSSAVASRFMEAAPVIAAAPRENRIVLRQKSQLPVLPEGCYALPHIDSMTAAELSCVKNFTIVHKTFDSICFIGYTDVRDLNFAKIISFGHMLIDYHQNNRLGPAIITLNNCFPKSIDLHRLPRFPTGEIDLEGLDEGQHDSLERFEAKLRRVCAKNNTHHCSWNPSTGEWKFTMTA